MKNPSLRCNISKKQIMGCRSSTTFNHKTTSLTEMMLTYKHRQIEVILWFHISKVLFQTYFTLNPIYIYIANHMIKRSILKYQSSKWPFKINSMLTQVTYLLLNMYFDWQVENAILLENHSYLTVIRFILIEAIVLFD